MERGNFLGEPYRALLEIAVWVGLIEAYAWRLSKIPGVKSLTLLMLFVYMSFSLWRRRVTLKEMGIRG
ncbi:MAG TPA: hypothetical protein EYP85_06115, partial [Armatimonadetes bacterium]|nr:hypothetical protein [Armatimonadota bacterium]